MSLHPPSIDRATTLREIDEGSKSSTYTEENGLLVARSLSVTSKDRFTPDDPCPVCGGHQNAPAGSPERCWGFRAKSGDGVFCTEEESDTWSAEAEAWFHATADLPEVSVNGTSDEERVPITLARLARDKGLPKSAFTALGARQNGSGVLFGRHLRLQKPKYIWIKGGSASDEPLWPMPGETVAEVIDITAGETDCVTLRHAGREAYAITSGEKETHSSLSTGHYAGLRKRGAHSVVIYGDGDDKGQQWMRHEAKAAQAAGLTVCVCDLSPLYDHFGAGIKDVNELYQSLDCDTEAFLQTLDEHTRTNRRVQIFSLQEMREEGKKEVTYLVNGLLSPGEKASLTAPPKNYKTWLALNFSRGIATGSEFLGRSEWNAPEPRPVIFVEEEGDVTKFARRVTRAFEGEDDAPFFVLHRMGFSVLDRWQVDWLIERIHERDAGLCVLDPWQRVTPGVNENDAGETGVAWDEVHRITDECPRCAVLVLHHANKAGGLTLNAIRGSSRFPGEVDLSIVMKVEEPGLLHASFVGRDVPQHLQEQGYLEIEFEAHDPFALHARGFQVQAQVGRPSTKEPVRAFFLKHGDQEWTPSDVAESLGIARPTIYGQLKGLLSEGFLIRKGRNYRLKQGDEA